ncbi:SRPBCC family protein [Oricola sp.]|uniref:SRPBCC family protein n=1 Tax=Oricola sp. TaxID=1979950 RepID=UPI003BA8ECCE
MPHYEITQQIDAPPERIWPVLTDAARLSDGNFSILEIDGKIAPGMTIRLRSEADPKRTFDIAVRTVDRDAGMVWESGLPFGLFKGTRRFKVTASGEGSVFHMREDYTGPLAGLMFRMIPDLSPTFRKFATGLKQAAEAGAR